MYNDILMLIFFDQKIVEMSIYLLLRVKCQLKHNYDDKKKANENEQNNSLVTSVRALSFLFTFKQLVPVKNCTEISNFITVLFGNITEQDNITKDEEMEYMLHSEQMKMYFKRIIIFFLIMLH